MRCGLCFFHVLFFDSRMSAAPSVTPLIIVSTSTSHVITCRVMSCHLLIADRRNLNILAWSRLGFDRPCAAAVAYLIRKWGMTLDYALDVVSVGRIGTNISPHYQEALEVYSLRHSLGDLLCSDCTVSGLTKEERCVCFVVVFLRVVLLRVNSVWSRADWMCVV